MRDFKALIFNKQQWRDLLSRPEGKIMAGVLVGSLLCVGLLAQQYVKYSRIVDRQIEAGPFSDTLNLYAAPRTVEPGDRVRRDDLVDDLHRIAYREQAEGRRGWFRTLQNGIEIHPPGRPAARIEFARGRVARIVSLAGGKAGHFQLDPELIANLSASREKRRLVRFAEIPKTLVNAVVATEDKRFFNHNGFDVLRLAKAAYVDVRDGGKHQGASTITMQLARSLWLDGGKTWRRKFTEMMIAAHLEDKLTKEQIFEYYVNEVYLGRRGTFSVNGVGQAAWEYFGKDLRQLTLPEAALIAGMIQRPGYFDPFRNIERATRRRNLVLRLMRENGFITEQERATAAATPIRLSAGHSRVTEAPYFMDLLAAELQNRFSESEVRVRNVYSTIDADLQRAAMEAVAVGAAKLDKAAAKIAKDGAKPEVALVALDPRTGEIKALVGGRSYARSQLNRALARRPVGSTFKPFVYAAALNTAVAGGEQVLTAATVVDDEPTSFQFGDELYEPANFKGSVYGPMTLRQALARSSNVATVKVAEAVGYKRISDLARGAGLETARGTPAVALGAYDATPLELAGAYTAFANNGVALKPTLVSQIRGQDGRVLYQHKPESRQVLDPRIAYLMVNLMEGVMNNGTGAPARAAGFYLPAAGKTGTSRDGWFAGFTSELLTVVWVGFDDYRDLNMEGGKAALPVWTEFMKRAHKLPRYADAKPFPVPSGISSAEIDPESGQLAAPGCFEATTEYFIAGTEPSVYCELHSHLAAATEPQHLPLRPSVQSELR